MEWNGMPWVLLAHTVGMDPFLGQNMVCYTDS